MTRFFIAIACLLVACSSNDTPGSDTNVIIERRLAFNEAIAHHQLNEMDQYCTGNILVITSRNARMEGMAQYVAFLEQDFKTKEGVVYIRTPENVDIFPAWEMAAESGHWKGIWTAGGDKIIISGSYYAKWKKVNGQWRISTEVFTPLQCEGGNYCIEKPS